MTINRIRELPPEIPDGMSRAGSYWELRTEGAFLQVDERTAQWVARAVSRWWGPRWLAITDRNGSRVRIRRRDVLSLVESTPATRASDRRMEQALEGEERTQRPPWMEGL